MGAHPEFRRRTRRPIAAAWVVAYLLGVLAASLHYGLVGTACARTERWLTLRRSTTNASSLDGCVESSGDAALCGKTDTAGLVKSTEHGASEPQSPTSPDDDSHEHCQLDPTTPPAAPTEVAPITFVAWLEEHFEPPTPVTPQPPFIAILRLAPGRSPPSV